LFDRIQLSGNGAVQIFPSIKKEHALITTAHT